MFDVTVITVTNLHLSPHELLATLAIPFGTCWAWKSRYDLAKIVTALRRRFLPGGRQETTGRLSGPSEFWPYRSLKRLPGGFPEPPAGLFGREGRGWALGGPSPSLSCITM